MDSWAGFLQGSDRIILDSHPYFSFGGMNPAPIDVIGPQGFAGGTWPRGACDAWGPSTNER
jgi:glucan 1,3-beta-glucosidase